ncbi:ribonuclease Trv [Plectosphaerella plurivora]|uniref:Ribonuclease T2-like n=1 Tax=Plectosphaerella plurivora TaxID=936078 RepID=A0A9P8VJL1_9PEZI|nr:ribonuclease Trv [Plectosphaerella plurivora]
MFSRTSMTAVAVASGAMAAFNSVSCPLDVPLSCHNTTVYEDTCCFNAPGGQILQTQFWDSAPATGPDDSWTIHGLWPDNCDGTWEQFCAPEREYTNITAVLQADAPCTLSYMETFWKDQAGDDEDFWEHEFNKHGTCMSTLEPECYPGYAPGQEVVDYFKRTVALFKTLPSYKWLEDAGIVPSTTATYTLKQINAALASHHGHDVIINCNKQGEINELWYHFNVQGSVQTGKFVPAVPFGTSTCPAEGIKYLPKQKTETPSSSVSSLPSSSTSSTSSIISSSSVATSSTASSSSIVVSTASTLSTVYSSTASSTTTSASVPTPSTPSSTLSGRGRFYAVSPGVSNGGFLITAGTWYRGGGTPATYTATPLGDGSFSISSSRGRCAVQEDSQLLCAASVTVSSAFGFDGTYLTYEGSSTFYAAAVPSGTTQGLVFTEANAVTLQFTWTAV